MPFQTYNPRQSDEWTIERIVLLLKLDAENILSRAQIANELHRQTGSRFSRNAIIGKLLRLGAPRKEQKTINNPKRKFVPKTLHQIKSSPDGAPCPLPDSLRLSLMDLGPISCRYITSMDGLPIEFCGHPISQRSYCAGHYQICYYEPRNQRPDVSHRNRVMNARRYKQSLLKCEVA
jgi:hypothetical protein